jgi:threonine dehydrogenase-like Zn-dependent dehydrogenase
VVKTLASSICNATDNHIVEGIFFGSHDHYPQILGHEVCGRVVETGEGVTDVKIGDRVGMYTNNGAFAEYVKVDAGWCYAHIPDNVSDEEASVCEMFDGAYRSTIAPAQLQPGERVLIVGCGPMGLTAIGGAAETGAVICAVDFYQNRLDMARRMGAKYTYNRAEKNVRQIAEAIRRDVGEIDTACMCIALDRSKELDAFTLPLDVLRRDGRMTSLNVDVKPEAHNHRMNPYLMNWKNIKYRHNLERYGTCEDFRHGYDLVGEGKIRLGQLITHKITLDELPWALDMCHNHLDECVKFVVYPRVKEGATVK